MIAAAGLQQKDKAFLEEELRKLVANCQAMLTATSSPATPEAAPKIPSVDFYGVLVRPKEMLGRLDKLDPLSSLSLISISLAFPIPRYLRSLFQLLTSFCQFVIAACL